MLDETESSESSTSTSTRRRAAGRPAGPPAALNTDIFAPPAETKADRPAKKAAPASDKDDGGDQPAKKTTAKKAPAKKAAAKKAPAKKAAAKAESDKPDTKDADAPKGSVMFQPPETTTLPPRPKPEASNDRDDRDDDADGGDDGPRRRRRSRGGRRRRKGDDGDGNDTQGNQGNQDNQDDDSDDGDGNATRRRRRRARSGEGASSSPDDPENTVVKVREGRSAEDEITGVSGSTRLEAKKQRRRVGREAGRRRAPIVSEAEFLARRESVKRQMVVRQRDDYTQIAVLEDSVLVEHYVARESQTSVIGNVYLGKVQNVLPSMEAAFIDIGAGRNAVLYAGEVDWSTLGNGKQRKIEDALSPGQTVLVQATKDPIGQKGARLTSQVSLPGRFLV
ncbi:MAG: Rne/Rng family ribonuclease, partial [Aeromicrobium sp.]